MNMPSLRISSCYFAAACFLSLASIPTAHGSALQKGKGAQAPDVTPQPEAVKVDPERASGLQGVLQCARRGQKNSDGRRFSR